MPAWAAMWLLVLTLFFTAKCLTLRELFASGCDLNTTRVFGYIFLWPGMDARGFCSRGFVPLPRQYEYLAAGAKALLGAALLWLGVRLIAPNHPLLRGWTGMVGLVFLLHFGLFDLLSLAWRAGKVHAPPIMQSPGTASSLSRFWGGSWNAAFTDLVHEHFFKPLARRFGGRAALVSSFLLSGALHELVISVPARGGYGLPTLYFGLQAAGLLLERSRFGRRAGLGRGLEGWCFVALVAGAPAFFLFPPVFVRNVILPMLHAIGAA
jgi:alginate O-acetyltransferase complex protein AlgI